MNGAILGVPAGVIFWPLLFGLGAYLFLVSQPIGRPRADLAERLRRLDVDERLRRQDERALTRPLFASPLLEALLRPVLEDCGRLVGRALGRAGVGADDDLGKRLELLRPGVGPTQFVGEKVASGLVGLVTVPAMDWLGIHPFGPWPVWLWLAGFAAGFFLPDWELERRAAALRTRCLMELPVVLDLMTIACSAGLGLEQALATVAQESRGAVARELQAAARAMTLGERSLGEAMADIAARSLVPELGLVAGQLRAAHEQGLPLVATLAAQAEALRERKRLRLVEEGGKATVRMVLPVALFILPVLFVVLVLPAALEIMQLGG